MISNRIISHRRRKIRLLPLLSRNEHPLDPPGPTPPAPVPVPTPSNNGEKVYNQFVSRYGAREWDATVTAIQTWYYGSMVKDNWCATSMSYMCDQAGCLNRVGGKNENVYDMMTACQAAAGQGQGTFYTQAQLPDPIPSYCICFFLWRGTVMTATSSKHVTLCETDNGDGTLSCIGGNQSDEIRTSRYAKDRLYAIYVIGG